MKASFSRSDKIWKYSNPNVVKRKLSKYLHTKLYRSNKKDKKYMINKNGKWIHFGQMGYEDYTKHKDRKRRSNYLKRSSGIKGKWSKNRWSPNNLSRKLLW